MLFVSAEAAAQQEPRGYPECNRQPTDAEVAAAKGAFQAGQASFNEADYERAITYWEDAYRRDCTAHALLLNLARVYELQGNKRQAVLALETYLLRKPDAEQRAHIDRRIEVLNSQIASEQAAPPVPVEPTPAPVPSVPAEPPPAVESSPQRPILPLIVAGAGGAVALVGGILYLGARSDLNDAKEKCPNGSCPSEEIADEGTSANTRVNVTGAVTLGGLAVAAGGTIWYFVSKPAARSGSSSPTRRVATTPRLTPSLGSNFTGLFVSGAF
jgi:tetratricopeptide (TPR) repeat protein